MGATRRRAEGSARLGGQTGRIGFSRRGGFIFLLVRPESDLGRIRWSVKLARHSNQKTAQASAIGLIMTKDSAHTAERLLNDVLPPLHSTSAIRRTNR